MPNQFFGKARGLFQELPTSIQKRIFFKGSVPHKDLNLFYNAADLFVSLSLHHDEDFGMSVAEAMATGLPCVLTDWGGIF